MADKLPSWGKAGVAAAVSLAAAGTPTQFSISYTTPPVVPAAKPEVTASTPVTVTEGLLNAKIDAVEAKVETRFAQIVGRLDTIAAEIRNMIGRMDAVEKRVGVAETRTQGIAEDLATLKERVSHLPTKGWFVTGSLAIVGALTAVITFGQKLQALVH